MCSRQYRDAFGCPFSPDWIVPLLRALEAEHVAAFASDGLGLDRAHLGGVVAVGGRAPSHQAVAL